MRFERIMKEHKEIGASLEPILEKYYREGYDLMSLYLSTLTWCKAFRETIKNNVEDKKGLEQALTALEDGLSSDEIGKYAELTRPLLNYKPTSIRNKEPMHTQALYNGYNYPYDNNSGTNDPLKAIDWGIALLREKGIVARDYKLSAQSLDCLVLRLRNEVDNEKIIHKDPLKILATFLVGNALGSGKFLKDAE